MAIKTKEELRDYWNSQLNTNGSNAITGQKLNVGGVDIVDSMAMSTDIADVIKWPVASWIPNEYQPYDLSLIHI